MDSSSNTSSTSSDSFPVSKRSKIESNNTVTVNNLSSTSHLPVTSVWRQWDNKKLSVNLPNYNTTSASKKQKDHKSELSNSKENDLDSELRKKFRITFPLSETNVLIMIDENWQSDDGTFVPPTPSFELKKQWKEEQWQLASQLDLHDNFSWNLDPKSSKCIKYIGGVDLSFAKNSKLDAVASIVICEYPSCRVVYETYSMIKLTAPYIAGYLAFREVPHILKVLEKIKEHVPQYTPQLLMIDGNGFLHMRGFGQACHLGVLCGIPCLGVAKKLLYADGITDQYVQDEFRRAKGRDTALLIGESGVERAYAYKARHNKGTSVLYISAGHDISLRTSMDVVRLTMKGNELPEPVFQADHLSREFLRLNYSNL